MRIVFYDLLKSFEANDLADDERRVLGTDGRELRLSRSIWKAGRHAIDVLLRIAEERTGAQITLPELVENFAEFSRDAEEFLDLTFYPDLIDLIEKDTISVDIGVAEFREVWKDYEMASKALVFLDLMQAVPLALHDPKTGDLPRKIAAIATLHRIDDCALGSFDDGMGLDDAAADVERLRSSVIPSLATLAAINAAKRAAISERASEHAGKRHQKTNAARKWVMSEWQTHRSQYEDNKSAFTRDYVRRLRNEQDVVVTEKQLREVWLKDPRPAGNPDGLPADG